ncbi:MAG: glycosyltransferase family A protein [Vicinamibacterales bacterium]|nr:glycosyltransferase family A protein [Vicinamibacterales bacterium]
MSPSRGLPAHPGRAVLSMESTLVPPRIAVIMAVYNAETYVAEAVRSVLEQTYADFHLIVIDDGSTDGSASIVESFSDPRVQLVRLPVNGGQAAAANVGIAQSRSEFIARMDADDICLPRRLERQIAFLDSHPDVVMCGTWARHFGDDARANRPPADPRRLRARLFLGFALDQPTIMMRRSFLEHHGLRYREDLRQAEDLDLYFRAAALGTLANVPEILLRTRAHSREISVAQRLEGTRVEARLRVEQLRLLMPEVTAEEADFHVAVLDGRIAAPALTRAHAWLTRLSDANRARRLYDVAAFRRELREVFYRLHVDTDALGISDITTCWASPLADGCRDRVLGTVRLLARSAARPILPAGRFLQRWFSQRDPWPRMPQA